ncbi:MAG: flagellar export protein FliJ [Dehalococcoidia bacterium]|nr:flagellar export protein FliJ [Dehalococcoidia bacterium]
MARGPFRLQQVLDHKRREEEAKTLELASLAAEQRRLEDDLHRLREQEEQQLASLSAVGQTGAIDASRVDRALSYLDAIEASISKQLAHVAALESRVSASREALVGILKEKQLLERLREQHAGEAREAQQRRETDQSDEMASQRHIRRTREGA